MSWTGMRTWLCAALILLTAADDKSTELVQEASCTECRPLLLATLGGGMVAVHQATGDIIWKLKDEPVVKVPEQDSKLLPQFLPDPRHGFLYMYGPRAGEPHVLRKLPFTIPELVANAPCRSSDGILYTGKKSDMWFMIDPETGVREHVSGFDKGHIFNNNDAESSNTCSLDKQKGVYVARTEYTILMHNSRSNHVRWNVTFFDYTSHDMGQDMLNDYGLLHFTSTSNGRVMSFDRKTGNLMWSRTLDTPVVAAYLLDRDGLISVPFNSVGDDTMDHIMDDVKSLRNGRGLKNSDIELFPTLYVGEHNHGLYALSSLVDKNTITISTEQTRPLLLEGPVNQDQMQVAMDKETREYYTNVHYEIKDLNLNNEMNTVSAPFLLLGHYKMPELYINWFLNLPNTNILLRNNYFEPSSRINLINGKVHSGSENDSENETKLKDLTEKKHAMSVGVQTEEEVTPEYLGFRPIMLYKQAYVWLHQQENKGLKVALIVLVGLVVTLFWFLRYQAREFEQLSQSGSHGSNVSSQSSSSQGEVTALLEEIGDGEMRIGKITFHTDYVLGKGCEGTFVYKGSFDKRAVAVKRLLPECFTFADREVTLLRESDAHANVVRYYCTERDKQFRYIALELCAATLQDYVEKRLSFECNIDPIEILRQATLGLSHLHSMDIVHRDIKPHNVLISMPTNSGEVRAMISDFGLSKKLHLGRTSFSRRSGVTGTDGWIAPEILNGERTTTSVDIFSLGCVFYYVISQGRHPFGDVLRRQANILSDDYNISHIDSICAEEDVVLIKILIRAMISTNPYKRPPCDAVLKNPMFWSPQIRLNFLQDVSDQLEGGCGLDRGRLERGGLSVVRGDWRAHVCERVAADLRTRRTYKGHCIVDLLRAMRNKKHHYRELEMSVRESLGRIPDGFLRYWLRRFPLLLPHLWCHMQDYRNEDALRTYYPHFFTFHRDDIPELLEETQLSEELCGPDKNELFTKSRICFDEGEKRKVAKYNSYRNNKYSPRRYKPSGDFEMHRHNDGLREIQNAQSWRREKRKEDRPEWTLPLQ